MFCWKDFKLSSITCSDEEILERSRRISGILQVFVSCALGINKNKESD